MTPSLNSGFYNDLMRFLLQIKQQVISIGVECGLSGMQALTLLMLDDSHALPMSGLCQRFDCDASNITGIIDGLEQKGLVSRQPSLKDRRVKLIHLEPSGKSMQAVVLSRLAERGDQLFSTLQPVEVAQFASLVKKLTSEPLPR